MTKNQQQTLKVPATTLKDTYIFHSECFIQMFSSVASLLALGCAIPRYKAGLIFIGAYSSLSSLCNLTFTVLLCKSGQHLSVGAVIKKGTGDGMFNLCDK